LEIEKRRLMEREVEVATNVVMEPREIGSAARTKDKA